MKEDENADLINDEVEKLLQKAKSVTQCVKMSSILPTKHTPNSERLNDLNTKVRSTYVDHDVLIVDNDANFTFSKGAVDDAASPVQRDGIHLSESGTDRLLRNLHLPKQPVRRKQRQRHESTRRSAIRVNENNQQQQRQRHVRRSTVRDVTQELTRDEHNAMTMSGE